jgi:peroxiredoxin
VFAQDAKVPRPAPEFALQLPTGKQVLLSQYKGKVIILEFLLTTCPHCQKTSEVLSKLHKEYGSKGFQPLGVAINDGAKELIPAFVQQFKVTYPVGVGDRTQVGSFLQHSFMKQMMMPQVVVIDRHGVIQAQHGGDDQKFFADEEKNLTAWIQKLLGTPAKKTRSK